jgi:hypothetical protein
MVAQAPHQTRNAKAESGKNMPRASKKKRIPQESYQIVFLGSHDCRAPLTSHSPHLHDRSLMRGTLTQKQALESLDRRNLFSRAFASHYSALRVVPRFFSHRSFRGLAYCHREHVAQLRHDNHSDVKGRSLPFCGSSLQSGLVLGSWPLGIVGGCAPRIRVRRLG